jgi:ectoine hydroxylase-related dioxygenase (phytanoyl-CoA dioxygenase family)
MVHQVPHSIEQHVEAIRVHGYTVLEDALPPELTAAMRERFDALLAEHAAREPTNRGASRYQMYLPWEAPFADPRFYEREDVLAILEVAMEPDPALVYFASDTPLPGSDYQRVHSDTRLLYPELDAPLPVFGIVVNLPLVDCTEENGSLEFWPGTHLLTGPVELERLPPGTESRRGNLRAGSLLVRDLRMWHRGTPNRSARPRPHLALVYGRSWFRFNQQPPTVPQAAFDGLSERGQRLLRFARLV